MPRSRRHRTSRRHHSRKHRGGDVSGSTPLITYTPRYHEIDCEIGKMSNFPAFSTLSYYGSATQHFYGFPVTAKYKAGPHSPQSSVTIHFLLGSESTETERAKLMENWYIVYGAIKSYDGFEPIFIVVDNYGQIHDVAPLHRVYGHPVNHMAFIYDWKHKQPLPDAFIDALLDKFTPSPSIHPHCSLTYPKESIFPLKKPTQPTLPHRQFEISSDLAAYIQQLEETVRSIENKGNIQLFKRGANNTFITSVPESMLRDRTTS